MEEAVPFSVTVLLRGPMGAIQSQDCVNVNLDLRVSLPISLKLSSFICLQSFCHFRSAM